MNPEPWKFTFGVFLMIVVAVALCALAKFWRNR